MIGGLIGFGAWLVIIGMSLLRDIETSMRTSITESIAGDLQVYSGKAKDELALFGGGFMGRSDIGAMDDFSVIQKVALNHPNVAAFVPLGLDMALIGRGNEMDDLVTSLRASLASGDQGLIAERLEQIRFQIEQLKSEQNIKKQVVVDRAEVDKNLEDIEKSLSPGFLQNLDEERLQCLEIKIAPLSGEKSPIYLSYFATDMELYKQNFSKFKVLEGQELPPGERGLMLGRKVREEQLKNKVARILDQLHKRVIVGRAKIAKDDEARRDSQDLVRQYDQIMSYLDRPEAEALSQELAALGISGQTGDLDLIHKLTSQVKSFLEVNDDNLLVRYQWFYKNIAPKIKLYELSPGDTVVLRNYTKSGYIKSIPVKVYGVFGFDGLENAALAGGLSLLDLVTFRELYGQMTDASRIELKAMRDKVKVRDISRSQAEDALFGGSSSVEELQKNSVNQETSPEEPLRAAPVLAASFQRDEVKKGLALNAALILKDFSKLQETASQLKEQFNQAQLDLRVVDWQKAAGTVGQFVNIVRGVLLFAIFIIFLVALVIINNSIVVSTFHRIKEIGTMRAIGAQRSFVLGMILIESGVSGLLGASMGSVVSLSMLIACQRWGIAAGNDFLTFLFSGPRLYPKIYWDILLVAPVVIGFIATIASLYAARFAANIAPIEAMQERE
jgi:ABC-type lipoprotein release transport system permease subunit